VIDGWGLPGPQSPPAGDAIAAADTPVMSGFAEAATGGYTRLDASSLAVGLPEGRMGNSEVGHLNIGAGRVVWQDSVRIDQTLRRGELGHVDAIAQCFARARAGNGRLHLLGLVSDGGVHSHSEHLFGLLQAARDQGVPRVFVHAFGDGRDTEPRSADRYLQQLLDQLAALGIGELATVVGRYYAMDRDKRWDRVLRGLRGLVLGDGEPTVDAVRTVRERYARDETDEFLSPIILGGPESRVQGPSVR
jgi:2,3-bisphosphoglycerate-independent phosphoglycerate mutase